MYSPKISEELVPALYRLAKERRMPMTRLVDGIIRRSLTLSHRRGGISARADLPDGKATEANLVNRFPVKSEPRNAVA